MSLSQTILLHWRVCPAGLSYESFFSDPSSSWYFLPVCLLVVDIFGSDKHLCSRDLLLLDKFIKCEWELQKCLAELPLFSCSLVDVSFPLLLPEELAFQWVVIGWRISAYETQYTAKFVYVFKKSMGSCFMKALLSIGWRNGEMHGWKLKLSKFKRLKSSWSRPVVRLSLVFFWKWRLVFVFFFLIIFYFKEKLKLDMHNRGKTEMPSGKNARKQIEKEKWKVFWQYKSESQYC